MAPGLLDPNFTLDESEARPQKKVKFSEEATFHDDDEDVAVALPSHPLGIKPAGNAYTASENIKSRCGSFSRLPDELLGQIFESFDTDVLIRLGSTCRALYAFTRLDELWRALFVRYVMIVIPFVSFCFTAPVIDCESSRRSRSNISCAKTV